MIFRGAGRPLEYGDAPDPQPGTGQLLLRVCACGICRTDLHLIDGDLPHPKDLVIPGHQIVATVEALGPGVEDIIPIGSRVGVPWLGWTCGRCAYCEAGQENLCDEAQFTGYTLDGGFAEYAVADQRYCFPLPDKEAFPDLQAAPLLCAGLIGYRCLRMCGEGAQRIGIYGFGAAAHIITQVIVWQKKEVYAFTRPGDGKAQDFARQLGAVWAGAADTAPPESLDAAIIFAPVGALVPAALKAVRKGGTVVCGGIHMSDIPGFPYRDLWEERVIRSVANLTRKDGDDFLGLAPRVPVRTHVTRFALEEANEALEALRSGAFEGAAVVVP